MTDVPASTPQPQDRRRAPLRSSTQTFVGQPSPPLARVWLAIVRTALVLLGIMAGYVLAWIIGGLSGIVGFGLC